MSRRFLVVAAAAVAIVIAAVVVGHAPTTPAAAQTLHLCDNGTVVSDPTNNIELVADCKILWGEKETSRARAATSGGGSTGAPTRHSRSGRESPSAATRGG